MHTYSCVYYIFLHVIGFMWIASVLVFCCSHTKSPQTRWLKAKYVYIYLTVLKPEAQQGSPWADVSVSVGWHSLLGSRGESAPLPFPASRGPQHSLASGPWTPSSKPSTSCSSDHSQVREWLSLLSPSYSFQEPLWVHWAHADNPG